jgi:hypothetical protein
MLRRVALVRTDGSEERIASIISVKRIDELVITLAVTSNRSTLRRNTLTADVVPSSPILVTLVMDAICSSDTSALRFLQEPHGVTYQKTAFFIVTALKTSNLYNVIVLNSVLITSYIYV